MNASEVLNRAADGLERDGWMSPDRCTDGPAPTCAQLAIGRVDGVVGGMAAERALLSHIGGSTVGDIWRWNDAPERTAAEVIEALRAAAVIEAARESTPTGRLLDGPRIPEPDTEPVPA